MLAPSGGPATRAPRSPTALARPGRDRVVCPAGRPARAVAVGVAISALASAHAPRDGRAAISAREADSIRYAVAITDVNRVGLSLTNYGFFGNNFNSRSPSFEFPLGSGYEHMSRAGLWVGAHAISDTGAFVGVSTAIVDDAQGTIGQSETEFTPAGNAIVRRSRIQNSRYYSPQAVSDQDFECAYSDRPARGPAGFQRERHTPLDILVRQRTLGFSLDVADAFVVARFDIVNLGPPLRDLYVGLYGQLVSGDRNAYSSWPPTSSSAPGSWYYKTYVTYEAGRRMYKEHYCYSLPYPDACNFAFCPPWAAVKLLSVRPGDIADKTVSLSWWSWSPGDTVRDTDLERYAILSRGAAMDPLACGAGGVCSPIMVLSVGPFAQVNPGDTVSVDCAFVGGEDEAALERHADYVQFAAGIDYRLPAPPPSPRLLVQSGANRVDLYWEDFPEGVEDVSSLIPGHKDFEGYRVYLGLDRQRPIRVAQFDLPDTTGFNTGFEAIRLENPRVVDGLTYRYHYRIGGLKDGFSYYGAVTSYDVGDAQVSSLESGIGQNKFQAIPSPAPGESGRGVTVFPNPYRVEARWDQGALVRDHYLWFANLPLRCLLKVFTLAGDLVFETRFDGDVYRGNGARGLYDPRQDLDTPPPFLSGASLPWNLVTRGGQAAATGLYLFSVEDLATGSVTRGRFLVIKSDRQE